MKCTYVCISLRSSFLFHLSPTPLTYLVIATPTPLPFSYLKILPRLQAQPRLQEQPRLQA